MEVSPKTQAVELIKAAKSIAIFAHTNPDGDAIGSVLALKLALTKLGKEVTAVVPSPIPPSFGYLAELEALTQEFTGTKDLVVAIDTKTTPVDKLAYKRVPEEGVLNIFVTPVKGALSEGDVKITQGAYKVDLIIVLDSPDLERLGAAYGNNANLFYETPIVNIDHHPGNDRFGKVNWVELTATSTAEILVSLLESLGNLGESLIDAEVATALLTGIITDTASFQNASTTPKSLTVAAQLVAAGARQQDIIRHLFKTKRFSTLKLWGRILTNLVKDAEHRFVYSVVTRDDFAQTSATEEELTGAVDELLKTVPEIDFALLVSERADGVHGSFRAVEKGVNVAEIAQALGGGGHEMAAAFQMPGATLANAQMNILSKVRQLQKERLARVAQTQP